MTQKKSRPTELSSDHFLKRILIQFIQALKSFKNSFVRHVLEKRWKFQVLRRQVINFEGEDGILSLRGKDN